jgi:hypothetical protein
MFSALYLSFLPHPSSLCKQLVPIIAPLLRYPCPVMLYYAIVLTDRSVITSMLDTRFAHAQQCSSHSNLTRPRNIKRRERVCRGSCDSTIGERERGGHGARYIRGVACTLWSLSNAHIEKRPSSQRKKGIRQRTAAIQHQHSQLALLWNVLIG